MTSPIAWTHQIVEQDQNPLAIPPRPAAAPAGQVEFREMQGRQWTYEVKVGSRVIGYIRWDTNDVWIARTPGSATAAATIRRFTNRDEAAAWLQQRLASRRRER
ncbi:MAG: hypothetical protein ACJ8AW_40770 [Rhodopila sp.]|jgi:hypothetical protein